VIVVERREDIAARNRARALLTDNTLALRLLAFITDKASIRTILVHLATRARDRRDGGHGSRPRARYRGSLPVL
jgi:hypothetical protein